MTNILNDKGASIAVTLLSAQPNLVTQLKTTENDGYLAVQVGFEEEKASKSKAGHLKASNSSSKHLREFRIINESNLENIEVGAKISADSFEIGDIVNVSGVSKGKGFAGTIKRHRFHRGRKTHGGQSYRRPGSIGSMYPQRIFPGKKMAGQMGYKNVTTKNLRIAMIDNELNVIGVEGAVPGPKKGLVLLRGKL